MTTFCVSSRRTIRQKDIMEWRTGKESVKAQDGEIYAYLPRLEISVAYVIPSKNKVG